MNLMEANGALKLTFALTVISALYFYYKSPST